MPEAKLNVVLLRYTPNPEELVAQSARLCYSAVSIVDLEKEIESNDQSGFIEKLADMRHLSPFEHINFTFGVEGVSRALSHQLVRHRLASYSQQSQRFVDFQKHNKSFGFVVPQSVVDKGFKDWFSDKMSCVHEWYQRLVENGIPPEDARFILPNACETKIVVTMNARELLHFFQHRCCNNAQWEIRALAIEMLKLAREIAPTTFKNAGPGCVCDRCHEGKKSCGKSAEVIERFSKF